MSTVGKCGQSKQALGTGVSSHANFPVRTFGNCLTWPTFYSLPYDVEDLYKRLSSLLVKSRSKPTIYIFKHFPLIFCIIDIFKFSFTRSRIWSFSCVTETDQQVWLCLMFLPCRFCQLFFLFLFFLVYVLIFWEQGCCSIFTKENLQSLSCHILVSKIHDQ